MSARASLFENVSTSKYLPFYEDGEFQPRMVAQFLKMNNNDVARISDLAPKSIRWDDRLAVEVRERLLEIANVCEKVAAAFGGDVEKTALWYQLPNPLLGNISPRDMIRLGRFKKLSRVVDEALAGNIG